MRTHQILGRASRVESRAFTLTRKRLFLCVLRQAGDRSDSPAKATRRSPLSSRATLHPAPLSRARIIRNVLPGFRFTPLHPDYLRCTKKGGGALIDATVRDPRHADARCRLSALGAWARIRARTPTGAPPRHLWQRTNATAQLQPALPGTWRHRVLPASGLSIQSSGLPRSTGRSAGRAYPPKPPECGVQIRPREPHSPRIQVCLENTSLRWARYCLVTDAGTHVNIKVTRFFALSSRRRVKRKP